MIVFTTSAVFSKIPGKCENIVFIIKNPENLGMYIYKFYTLIRLNKKYIEILTLIICIATDRSKIICNHHQFISISAYTLFNF